MNIADTWSQVWPYLPIQLSRFTHPDFIVSNGEENNGTAHFFSFSLTIDVTTEKVLQFIMPLKSIYNRNFGLTEQKMYF
jgi:hypothetical protein